MNRLFFLFLCPLALLATPAQVILMRNAEVSQESSALSLKGRQRAKALEAFFQGTPAVLSFGLPAAVFAVDESQETVSYLSKAIHVPVTQAFTSSEELTEELLHNPDYEGKMVLVCWPQEEIASLATKLGAKKTPKTWTPDAFDRLWILTFDETDKVTFNNLPQKLLYGDSSK